MAERGRVAAVAVKLNERPISLRRCQRRTFRFPPFSSAQAAERNSKSGSITSVAKPAFVASFAT